MVEIRQAAKSYKAQQEVAKATTSTAPVVDEYIPAGLYNNQHKSSTMQNNAGKIQMTDMYLGGGAQKSVF